MYCKSIKIVLNVLINNYLSYLLKNIPVDFETCQGGIDVYAGHFPIEFFGESEIRCRLHDAPGLLSEQGKTAQ